MNKIRRGIDVSSHNGDIDWVRVAASGISFAIVRCGYRGYGASGSLNEDKRFLHNMTGAAAAGLDTGAYFFSQAVNEAEAVEEAYLALDCLSGLRLNLPVFFDWEFIDEASARTDAVTGDTVTRFCLAFADAIRRGGYTPGVYASLDALRSLYDIPRLANLPIWAGAPGDSPPAGLPLSFWQYTFSARVPGIEGDVDGDEVMGEGPLLRP